MYPLRKCQKLRRFFVFVTRLDYYITLLLQGNQVAVGTHKGYVQIWDVAANKMVNMLEGHSARVGALAWNADMLSSGSRDRMILQRDIRTPSVLPCRKLIGHRQEVKLSSTYFLLKKSCQLFIDMIGLDCLPHN